MGDQVRKKGRGRAKLNFLSTQPKGAKFKIEVNSAMQPVGQHSTHLSRFIGDIARDGNRFPFIEPCFSEFKVKSDLQEAVDEVKDIFDFSSLDSPKDADDWIIDKLGELWRSYKSRVKKDNFTPYATDDVDRNLQIPPPPEIQENVWRTLIGYWSSRDAKDLCERNKISRSKKKANHISGSKTFANISNELNQELGRPPTRKEIFIRNTSMKRNFISLKREIKLQKNVSAQYALHTLE